MAKIKQKGSLKRGPFMGVEDDSTSSCIITGIIEAFAKTKK
jgi:hypothetical protein